MTSIMSLVAEFHAQFNLPMRNKPMDPALVSDDMVQLRTDLQEEETDELSEAMVNDDIVAIAKELADVVYVAYGTAVTYGIDLDAVLRVVHLSNMSKLGDDGEPVFRPDGKVIKGPNFWAAEPHLKRILADQPELPWNEQ